MQPKPNLGQEAIYRDLVDLVRKHAEHVPGARVEWRETAKGELVIAIVIPSPGDSR